MVLKENCPCKNRRCMRWGNCLACRNNYRRFGGMPACGKWK